MKILLILSVVFLAACNNSSDKRLEEFKKVDADLSVTNGETLFKANCASCHKQKERYVGPALEGAAARWESKELLYAFVRNSQEVISRNEYAQKIYEEYDESPMLPYPNLSDKDIDDILQYCNEFEGD